MIEITNQTLQYIFVLKLISMVSQVCIEPMLENRGYSEKQIQRITIIMEVVELVALIAVLKLVGVSKLSKK